MPHTADNSEALSADARPALSDVVEAEEQALTRAGRPVSGFSARTYLMWVLLGVAAAALAVLALAALTGRPDADPSADARDNLSCVGQTDDEGKRTVECVPGASTTTIPAPDLPVAGDPMVDGPIVVSQGDAHEPVPAGDLDEDVASCVTAIIQAEFSPEEFAVYAAGEEGPRSDEWLEVATDASMTCQEA